MKVTRGITILLILSGLLLISTAFSFSLNAAGTNETHLSDQKMVITVTPSQISVPTVVANHIPVRITVTGPDITSLQIYGESSAGNRLVYSEAFSSRPYYQIYLPIPDNLISPSVNLVIVINHNVTFTVPITFSPEISPIFSDISLVVGITLFLSGAYLYPPLKGFRYWLLLPPFILLSMLFGQRYDMYYMIAVGLRILDGVNPYLASQSTLPGLQYAYPPGFVPWSVFSDYIVFRITRMSYPGVATLNFIGTQYGSLYGVWRSLEGTNLLLLYTIIKLPMVLSFFWSFRTLRKVNNKVSWKLWFLNPITVVVGILWGQIDIIAVAFMLQSILYFRSGKEFSAVLFAGIGATVKVFPALLIPYMLIKSRHRKSAALGTLPAIVFTLAMYAATGNVESEVLHLFISRAVPTFNGIFIANGLTWQVLVTDLGFTTFPSLFTYVFIPVYFLLLFLFTRRNVIPEYFFITVLFLFFLTYNLVNPQYFIWIIPLLLMTGENKSAIVLSAISGLYLYLMYSFAYFINPQISWNYASSILGQFESLRLSITSSEYVAMTIGLISAAIYLTYFLKFLRTSAIGNKSTAVEH